MAAEDAVGAAKRVCEGERRTASASRTAADADRRAVRLSFEGGEKPEPQAADEVVVAVLLRGVAVAVAQAEAEVFVVDAVDVAVAVAVAVAAEAVAVGLAMREGNAAKASGCGAQGPHGSNTSAWLAFA